MKKGSGQGRMVTLIGVGLIGSWVAALYEDDLLVVDPDSYSAHHLILPCAEQDVLKVEAVKSYREKHMQAGHTFTLPYHVQELGEGFWCALADRNSIVVDATDGDEASYHLSHAVIRHRISLIQAKVHGDAGFVRLYPAASKMGWCCLGLENATPRASCFGIAANPEKPAPTNASLPIASAIASLVISAIGRIVYQTEAEEWRLDLKRFNLIEARLRRSSRCHHEIADEAQEKLLLNKTSDKLTCGELMEAARDRLGDSAYWRLDKPLTRRIRCGECRCEYHRWWFVGARSLRCERCGSSNMLVPPEALMIGDKLTELDAGMRAQTLIESGFPYWDIYRFTNGAITLDIEVDDRPILDLEEVL
jgi:hypothetical protein